LKVIAVFIIFVKLKHTKYIQHYKTHRMTMERGNDYPSFVPALLGQAALADLIPAPDAANCS
jgi:hypothetical protein